MWKTQACAILPLELTNNATKALCLFSESEVFSVVATNHLWMASYLHEMLRSYVEGAPDAGAKPYLHREALLAAQIVESGIQSFDSGFLAFVQAHPDTRTSSLYQVIRHFPDEAVKNGAALMVERLTTAAPGHGFLPIKTGVPGEECAEAAAGSLLARQRIREAACNMHTPGRGGSGAPISL